MFKLEYLKVFVAVAEAGELQAAARQLSRTPAALSMTLKQLEDDLGAPLFETERKGNLTPLGRQVLTLAQPVLGQFDQAVRDMRFFASGQLGHVKVAAVPSAASSFLPLALQALRGSRPEVQVELRDIDSRAVIEAVRNDVVDVGIASVTGTLRDLSVRRLLSDPFVWVCPPEHPWRELGRGVDWGDVQAQEFIANGLCSSLHIPALDRLVAQSHLMVLSTTSLLGFVRAGMGVTLLPAMAVPRDGSVLALPCAAARVERYLDVVTRDERGLSPAALALVEAILQVASAWVWNADVDGVRRA